MNDARVEMVYPTMPSPKRVIMLGAMTQTYYSANDEERSTVLPRFKAVVSQWQQLGARVLATLDDDLFMVGEPQQPGTTFYIMCEVDTLETVVGMIQCLREPIDGISMDQYVRFEARVGRPFFLLEPGS
jgi:hypothetical protein